LLKRVANRLKAASTVINDPTRKTLDTMLIEIVQLWVRDRAKPAHYYGDALYRKDLHDNIYAYVGTSNLMNLLGRINDPFWAPVVDNKILFDLFFRKTDIRLPKLLGYNNAKQFTIGNDVMWVSSRKQLLTALELLVGSSPTTSVFAKPAGGMQGKGCLLFDLSDVPGICADKGLELLSSDYVYQEVIDQHPQMAELHPSSLNTLRIVTYRADRGEASVMSAFVRMGVNRSFTDNVSAGGCFVGVDLEQGTLVQNGFTMPEVGWSVLQRHPDTEVVFDGFAIPFFQEVLSVAGRAAELMPLAVVGWDIAISEDGPVIIEGNANCHLGASEMADGGYYRNPVFRRLIEDHSPEMRRVARQFDKAYPGQGG